jgi:hypothetical protein
MSSVLRGIAGTAYGLLVDDGSLAVGIVAILAIAWAAAGVLGDATGWVLLGLLVTLVLGNLYRTAQTARAKTGG